MHTYIHTHIHTYIHRYMHTYIHAHTYIHTYIHTCIHTNAWQILISIYTYVHTDTVYHAIDFRTYAQDGCLKDRSIATIIQVGGMSYQCVYRAKHFGLKGPFIQWLGPDHGAMRSSSTYWHRDLGLLETFYNTHLFVPLSEGSGV